MLTQPTPAALRQLLSELTEGANTPGSAYILNSGDVGLMRSLEHLSSDEASQSANGGATIAAHAQHLRYGLSLVNRWSSEGGDPYADAKWDEAWTTTSVTPHEWTDIRRGLEHEIRQWLERIAVPRDMTQPELAGVIATVAHLAYHLGAIRQINRATRGPKEGTFITR